MNILTQFCCSAKTNEWDGKRPENNKRRIGFDLVNNYACCVEFTQNANERVQIQILWPFFTKYLKEGISIWMLNFECVVFHSSNNIVQYVSFIQLADVYDHSKCILSHDSHLSLVTFTYRIHSNGKYFILIKCVSTSAQRSNIHYTLYIYFEERRTICGFWLLVYKILKIEILIS